MQVVMQVVRGEEEASQSLVQASPERTTYSSSSFFSKLKGRHQNANQNVQRLSNMNENIAASKKFLVL